jgi:hypothetical protein
VEQATYAGSFELARTHLLRTSEFIHKQASTLRPEFKVVFNAFGGVDPSPFALFDAETVISVGLESFGTPAQIEAQLAKVDALHAVAAYVAAHGYFRSEVGGYWQIGRRVGADLLVLLKHVYGGKAIGLRYLDPEQRHAEVTVELGGKTRRFIYIQSNMGATVSKTLREGYGLASAEVAPALLELIRAHTIDGVLSKASMHAALAPEVWEALLPSLSENAVWMGEGSHELPSRVWVEKVLTLKLRAGWSYQTDNAELLLMEFRRATENELKVLEPPPKPKGFKQKAKALWKRLVEEVRAPMVNPRPQQLEASQPLEDSCEQFLINRRAVMPPKRKGPPASGWQIKM